MTDTQFHLFLLALMATVTLGSAIGITLAHFAVLAVNRAIANHQARNFRRRYRRDVLRESR